MCPQCLGILGSAALSPAFTVEQVAVRAAPRVRLGANVHVRKIVAAVMMLMGGNVVKAEQGGQDNHTYSIIIQLVSHRCTFRVTKSKPHARCSTSIYSCAIVKDNLPAVIFFHLLTSARTSSTLAWPLIMRLEAAAKGADLLAKVENIFLDAGKETLTLYKVT